MCFDYFPWKNNVEAILGLWICIYSESTRQEKSNKKLIYSKIENIYPLIILAIPNDRFEYTLNIQLKRIPEIMSLIKKKSIYY